MVPVGGRAFAHVKRAGQCGEHHGNCCQRDPDSSTSRFAAWVLYPAQTLALRSHAASPSTISVVRAQLLVNIDCRSDSRWWKRGGHIYPSSKRFNIYSGSFTD